MSGQGENQSHEVFVKERGEMRITGVKEVESFDDTGVQLRTSRGDMTVEGEGLRVGVLDVDRGVVTLSGRIDGIFYSTEDGEEKRGWLGRLFR